MEVDEQEMKDVLQSFVDIAEARKGTELYESLEMDIIATKWALSKIETLEQRQDEIITLLNNNIYFEEENDRLKEQNQKLIIERDYYKARYLEFNNAFIQGGEKTCQ